jgi:hypothetical protein
MRLLDFLGCSSGLAAVPPVQKNLVIMFYFDKRTLLEDIETKFGPLHKFHSGKELRLGSITWKFVDMDEFERALEIYREQKDRIVDMYYWDRGCTLDQQFLLQEFVKRSKATHKMLGVRFMWKRV